MSYDNSKFQLMLYLQIEDAKMLFTDFSVNKQGMLKVNVFTHPKNFGTVLQVANKFVSLLNHLLDNAEKNVYVNADEVPAIKLEASLTAQRYWQWKHL